MERPIWGRRWMRKVADDHGAGGGGSGGVAKVSLTGAGVGGEVTAAGDVAAALACCRWAQ